MTAYSSRHQLDKTRIFSYPTEVAEQPTYTFEESVHEAIFEGPQCSPVSQTSPNSRSPDHSRYSDDSSCRIRGEIDNNYGLHYYYGKLWDSSGEQQEIGSAWTTTSSPKWTTAAPHAFQALPSGAQIDEPHYISSSRNVGALDDRAFDHGSRVYAAPQIARVKETTFDHDSTMSPLPDSLALLPPGISLYRRVPSPRTIRSYKVDTSVAAHQRVPPEKISTYSELSPNIEFMERLKLEEAYSPVRTAAPVSPQPPPSNTTLQRPPVASSATGMGVGTSTDTTPLPSGSNATPPTSSAVYQSSTTSPPKKRRRKRNAVHESLNDRDEPGVSSTSSSTSAEEPHSTTTEVRYMKPEARKPSLACTFCRERKISCGRPLAGSADPTCNQCARRSFKCTYLTELNPPKSSTSRRRS